MLKPKVFNVLTDKFNLFISAIAHIIYPNVCIICKNEVKNESVNICPFCEMDFNYTYFESFDEPTILDKLFWGRVKIEKSFALLFFEKNKAEQPVLHALKYESRSTVGVQMGKIIGNKIRFKFSDIDLLIPVPIHPKKKFLRGFNQSELIAEGISEVMGVTILKDLISKKHNTISQTKMGKNHRWLNAKEQYVCDPTRLVGIKHVAIVDDVITTGATIESIAKSILCEVEDIQISVISLALTK